MMTGLIRALFALLLLASPAVAQQYPVVPDHSVIGRIGTGSSSGPSQAIPFSTLLSNMLGTVAPHAFWAGPTTAPNALPTFRALANTDLGITGDCSLSVSFVLTCTKTNGASFAPSATTDTTNAANISSGTLPTARYTSIKTINVQVFTTSGTFTYTPTAGMMYVEAACVGGGAAGGGNPTTGAGQGSAGGGGGAGGYARGVFSAATIGASKQVVIGGPGGGSSNASGAAGGNSTFGGTLLVANGGAGGTVGIASSATIIGPGAGGTASTSSTAGNGFAISGQTGYDGWSSNAANLAHGGDGGSSVYGGGGTTAMTNSGTSQPGNIGQATGAGGSGSSVGPSGTAGIGGNGVAGSCIMTEFNG